jgi:hypothetical protein
VKWCPRCERNRRLSSFRYSPLRAGGGHSGWCRDCHREYDRERHHADPRGTQLQVAVSLFRKFRDDPEFWERVKAADERAAAKVTQAAA